MVPDPVGPAWVGSYRMLAHSTTHAAMHLLPQSASQVPHFLPLPTQSNIVQLNPAAASAACLPTWQLRTCHHFTLVLIFVPMTSITSAFSYWNGCAAFVRAATRARRNLCCCRLDIIQSSSPAPAVLLPILAPARQHTHYICQGSCSKLRLHLPARPHC